MQALTQRIPFTDQDSSLGQRPEDSEGRQKYGKEMGLAASRNDRWRESLRDVSAVFMEVKT